MILNTIITVLVGLFVVFAVSMLILILALNTKYFKRAQYLFMSSLTYSEECNVKIQTLINMRNAGNYTAKLTSDGNYIEFFNTNSEQVGSIRVSGKYSSYAVLVRYRGSYAQEGKVKLSTFNQVLALEKELSPKPSSNDKNKKSSGTKEIVIE